MHKETSADLTGFTTTTGSLIYNGHGLYGQPEVSTDITLDNGIELPTGRYTLDKRLRDEDIDGLFCIGERDPTNGHISSYKPRAYIDNDYFNRADDANLGSGWDIIKDTGNGWNIISNKASCAEEGFETRDPDPRHADYIVEIEVTVSNNNNVVGALAEKSL